VTIPIGQSLEGVFLTGLRASTTRTGIFVLRAVVRVQQGRREQDGTFTGQEAVTRDLTQRGRTRYRPGDACIASGHVNTNDAMREGQKVHCREFVARRIGHDAACARYKVTRTRRRPRPVNPPGTRSGSVPDAMRTASGQAS
jgi:single-strand DNA-binding protein